MLLLLRIKNKTSLVSMHFYSSLFITKYLSTSVFGNAVKFFSEIRDLISYLLPKCAVPNVLPMSETSFDSVSSLFFHCTESFFKCKGT